MFKNWRFHFIKVKRETRYRMRWAFMHVALVIFFCDFIAAFWPAFDRIWTSKSHFAVAGGTILATLAEYAVRVDEAEIFTEHKEEPDEVQHTPK